MTDEAPYVRIVIPTEHAYVHPHCTPIPISHTFSSSHAHTLSTCAAKPHTTQTAPFPHAHRNTLPPPFTSKLGILYLTLLPGMYINEIWWSMCRHTLKGNAGKKDMLL